MRVGILFTSYNRREKTLGCINSLYTAFLYCANSDILIKPMWFITDASSSDGTLEAIKASIPSDFLSIRTVDSSTFYSQGMRQCMEMTSEHEPCDYYILLNDDVTFREDFLYRLFTETSTEEPCVIVGAIEDENGHQSYGGIRYNKLPREHKKALLHPLSIKFSTVAIDDKDRFCHTFNANFVLIPGEIFTNNPFIDNHFIHSLGDFDYGLSLWERKVTIKSSDFYVGQCTNNSRKGTWMDKSLSTKERLAALNSIKGAPTKLWFYYIKKHFGILPAMIHSVTPYIRIFLKK